MNYWSQGLVPVVVCMWGLCCGIASLLLFLTFTTGTDIAETPEPVWHSQTWTVAYSIDPGIRLAHNKDRNNHGH